jgi:ribosomal protein S18 acetylase RimI-like enzyme
MTVLTDADLCLYLRGAETLLGSWEEYVRGATGAAVRRFPGVAIAVFPTGPERAVYNNAFLERDLAAAERADALDAVEATYAAAGVTRFAAWVHERDQAMRGDLERRGYTLDSSTRAMGMALDEIRLPRPQLDLGPPDWLEYLRILRIFGAPPGLLRGADPARFHVLVARLGGENVATAMAFDHGGDCGIYNVGTLERARRRGLGTALTALQVHDARPRMPDGESAVDADGRGCVRRRGLPRSRPDPRVRALGPPAGCGRAAQRDLDHGVQQATLSA